MGFTDRMNRINGAVMARFADHTATVVGHDPVGVIYDDPFKAVTLYEDQVSTVSPACSMLDEDVARLGVQYDTGLTIHKNGALVGAFTVSSPEPDGSGFTRLTLTFA